MAKKKKNKIIRWRLPEPKVGDDEKPTLEEHMSILLDDYFQSKLRRKYKADTNSGISKKDLQREINIMQSKMLRLHDTFQAKLIEKENHPTYEMLKKLDTIDLSDVDIDSVVPDDYFDNFKNYLNSLSSYVWATAPCYKEGLLIINKTRTTYFNVKDVDTEKNSITVYLRTYQTAKKDGITLFELGAGATVKFAEDKHAAGEYTTEIINQDNFSDMYARLSARQLGWDEEQADFWTKVILQNAVDQEELFRRNGTSHAMQIANMFETSMVLVNFLLSENRPVIKRKPKAAKQRIDDPDRDRVLKSPDEPRVRVLGLIKFKSVNPPIRTEKNTVRHYTLSEWGVRGHIRRYKNGKCVYINPTTHKRKALKKDENAAPVQHITKVKGPPKLLEENNIETTEN